MTDAQAKAIGIKSARTGRKRAKNLIGRVVTYFLDHYACQTCQIPRSALEADIRKALLDVEHPARDNGKVDAFIEKTLNDTILEDTLVGRRFVLKM